MRELSREELDLVHGGGVIDQAAGVGATIGSLGGAVITGTLRGAATGGTAGAVLGGAAGFGWWMGSEIYERTS